MFNAIIRFSLRQRPLVAAIALFTTFYGAWGIAGLPIDVFPDLSRPRVTVITEDPGRAPGKAQRRKGARAW